MHVPLSEDLVMSSQYRFISNSEPIKGIYMYVNCTGVKENVGQVKNFQIFFSLMQAIHFCIHARASIIGPSNAFVKCFSPYAPNHRPSVAGSNSEEKIVPFYQKRDIYMSAVDLKNQTGVIHFILTVHEVGFDILVYGIYVSLRCWSQYTPPVVFPRNITKCVLLK